MRYQIFGPFTIPRKQNDLIDRRTETQRDLWNDVVGAADKGFLMRAVATFLLSAPPKA